MLYNTQARLGQIDMRNYMHNNSNPKYRIQGLAHLTSPLNEPLLIKKGRGNQTKIDGQLETKLSETIPLMPSHKDYIKEGGRNDLKTFVDKLDRENMNLSVRAGQTVRRN